MANAITFVEAPADSTKGFRIGRPESLFRNNVTFTVTGYKFGNYQVDGHDTQYAGISQSILLTTSIGEDLPLNRLLKGRKIVYDNKGEAHIVEMATFKAELLQHMLTLGRREDTPDLLKGTVEDAAKHALKFFTGKTLKTLESTYFAKDDSGRLVPGSSTIQFTLV